MIFVALRLSILASLMILSIRLRRRERRSSRLQATLPSRINTEETIAKVFGNSVVKAGSLSNTVRRETRKEFNSFEVKEEDAASSSSSAAAAAAVAAEAASSSIEMSSDTTISAYVMNFVTNERKGFRSLSRAANA